MLNKLGSISFFLFTFLFARLAIGMDFYADCIKGYDFGGTVSENAVITPLNPICQDRCERECGSFSRLSAGIELNDTTIITCQSECQNGRYFTSKFYEEKKTDPPTFPPIIELKPAVTTLVNCDNRTWAKRNVYTTRFTDIKNGDQMRLILAGNSSVNKVYLCGKKQKEVKPIFSSPVNSQWDNNSSQTQWTTKLQHECLYDMTDSEFSNLTNVKLWSGSYLPLAAAHTLAGANPSYNNINGPCKWSARNRHYTNTEIYVADGDELSLMWTGVYGHAEGSGGGFGNNFTTNDYAKCMRDPANSFPTKTYCSNLFYDDSALEIKPPGVTTFMQTSNQPLDIWGEAARKLPVGTANPNGAPPSTYNWYGLSGIVIDNNLKTTLMTGESGCGDNRDNFSKPGCVRIDDLGKPTYLFNGVLTGFSSVRSPLGIRHNDSYTSNMGAYSTWWNDNMGGYEVKITWGGCPYYNGARLQYVVAQTEAAITEAMWQDVPATAFQARNFLTINATTVGTLYFRIKTLVPPPFSDPTIVEMYNSPGSYFGQYYVVIEKRGETGSRVASGPIGNLVKMIRDTLLGDPNDPTKIGAAQRIFDSITQNQKYIQLVQALMVFYVAFYGVGFMMGIVKLDQREALVRMVKIGILVTLISPNAWEFFSTYLVNLFIVGGIELIALIVSGSFSSSVVDLSGDPFAVFQIFDGPFLQLFSAQTWKKIYALICTGLLGFIVAVMVIFAALMYVLSLVKATLIYIYSLVGIAILILASPIFLACMLFEITRQFFDNWWKFLISYTLQPVMVFASIAIFNLVIMTLLYSTLNFTACPYCILGIDLDPLYSACWIPGYRTTLGAHVPMDVPNFFLPGMALSAGLAFALCAHGMYAFIGFIASLTSVLVTGTFMREATAAGPAEDAQQAGIQALKTTAGSLQGVTMGSIGAMRGMKKDAKDLNPVDSEEAPDGKK